MSSHLFESESQNKVAQIFVRGDVANLVTDIGGIDGNLLVAVLGGVERKMLDNTLDDRDETACADILRAVVDVRRQARHLREPVIGESNRHLLRGEERDVLLCERVARLPENREQVVL